MSKRLHLPVLSELSDGFARRIRYLRVSLTDRCNYRCTYCMPDEGMVFRPRRDLLTFEEIERLLGVFAGLGVKRVRLTGGEPTVRANVVELVARVAAIAGIERVVMTSNGHLFPELAESLARAGLAEVNISIDTLDPERFRALTRRGDLDRVIAGIDAARAAGLVVKLNAVALRGQNDDEVPALCQFAWDRGILPRFIEHMPMSSGQLYSDSQQLTAAEIRTRVSEHFGCELVGEGDGGPASGPSRYWRLKNGAAATGTELPVRRLGIISAMSEHFCDTCNRLRLSAIGDLHPCLAYDDATSLRDIVRAGGSNDDVRRAIIEAVSGKREGHQFQITGGGGPMKHMIAIGG
ncbi:MAG: GTP 3',8-cyclase MoaA [Myxococcota bacterium]